MTKLIFWITELGEREKEIIRFREEKTMLMIFQLHSCNISNTCKSSFNFGVQDKRLHD